MVTISNDQKHSKLKASIEELMGPLLKRILASKGFSNYRIKHLHITFEKLKKVLEIRKRWDYEVMSFLGKIEKRIDDFEENSGGYSINHWGSKIGIDLEKLLEKSGINPLLVSTIPEQKEPNFSQKPTTYEVGAPSNRNNQEDDAQEELAECRNELSPQQEIWLDSLSIFPLNTKLKKRMLIYWWIGLGNVNTMNLHPMQRNKMSLKSILRCGYTNSERYSQVQQREQAVEHSNSTTEQVESFFNYLVEKGILKPIHKRKHNNVIDQCTIKTPIHRRSSDTCNNIGKEGTNWHFDYNDSGSVRALLNANQKYLSSKDMVSNNVLGDNKAVQIVQFGRWRCPDLGIHNWADKSVFKKTNSQDHIEIDETDFLKKLKENVTFLSLQGISQIDELPESIGKVGNLRILDLRACHNLEKLPEKPQSISLKLKSHQGNWFNNLTHLDISECYLLVHMPKWMCELSNLTVLKGFVAGNECKEDQFCRLGDLSKLKKLRKLSIRIVKQLNPEDAKGLESLTWLAVLTVIWSINEHSRDNDKVQTISFPKNLEKLDIRCYPEAEAEELLNPVVLPKLKRLYIRGGKLTKIANGSGWTIEILRLRFLEDLEINWYVMSHIFTKLKYGEYMQCRSLERFPKNRSAWYTMTDGPFPRPIPMELNIRRNDIVPQASNKQMMMVELTGQYFFTNRPRLNLVAVLDVTGSMSSEKIEKMKIATLFMIKKLSSDDCLSIVILSDEARMLWPLRRITEWSRTELLNLLKDLRSSNSNQSYMFAGLKMGLNILKDAENSSQGTVGSIILMSDCRQTFGDATLIPIGNVAVHTFCFGENRNPMVLKSIAYNSMGGTFSDVAKTDNLIEAISVCLAGLLTVVVQDLTLTLTPIKDVSTVERVSAGDYVQSKNNGGPVTIKFGDLYSREVRKVLVELLLPAVDEEGDANVLEVGLSYKFPGIPVQTRTMIIGVCRMHALSADEQQARPEVIAEEIRMNTVNMIREAIALAEDGKLETARKKIFEAKYILENIKINLPKADELFGLLNAELEEILKTMESKETYSLMSGFAYSFLTSHDRQRTAARGDDIEKFLSFATPFMLKSLKQAWNFAVVNS